MERMAALNYVVLFIFGLVFGSFFNVLIYRLPRDLSIVFPGSHCPHCKKPIRWYDNIPLLSYIILRAKCRFCGAPISIRYPLVELAGGLIFAGVPLLGSLWGYTNVPAGMVTPIHDALAIAAISVFFLALVIDFEHQIIPDQLSVALFAIGWLGVLVLYPGFSPGWVSSLIGMFVLSAFFFAFALAIGGFGMGDVKLAIGMGALFGWQQLLVAAMISFVAGGAIAVLFAGYLLLRRKLKARIQIPFGPYLAVGSVVSVFVAERLMQWYLSFLK
jgi:leader peptidase (prepilin peptidase)/N-methyltransferase